MMSELITEEKSKFSHLYKNSSHKEDLQERRRKILLEEQKRKRNDLQDDIRGINEFVQKFRNKKKYRHKLYKQKYDSEHSLQLSEWLRQAPEDLDRWFLVPCPKGKRCLVIASDGHTEMYNKAGKLVWTFRSMLPGDGTYRNQVTILDCVYAEEQLSFYILDVIAYGHQDMVNCDTQFRFFWIKSKFSDNPLDEVTSSNEYPFIPLDFYDFEDESAISSCLLRYPQWSENSPELDGLLFYHKDSSYVYGTTPLVGWLLPFMVPEVLNLEVNAEYLKEKPENYVNYLHYMILFDEDLAKKKSSRKNKRKERMDDDKLTDEDNDISDVLNAERELEMETSIENDSCCS